MASLDTFIQEIEKRKEDEINLLERTLAEKKAEIKRTKETTVKRLQEQYLEESKVKSSKEAAKIVEAAKLKVLFEAINANMDSTFGVIKNEMKNYVQKPEYKNLTEKMISFAKNNLGPQIIIHCRDDDKPIFKDTNIPIGSSIGALGGIIAEDKDGRRELDLTFEEILRTKEEDVKSYLLERMARK
jgi:V/A-type H+/Na+-transporting ATPase subunit E